MHPIVRIVLCLAALSAAGCYRPDGATPTITGKEMFRACTACHGDHGQGNPAIQAPAIAGQLKAMCEEKLKSKLVEPSSDLWEPLTFLINQWPRLTRFYEVPGVPLDTNLVEQKLIIPVRYLAASFNYKTETGAEVGDRMMSLIATAHANGVEPVAYLTHCLRNRDDLARRPADYLPWLYRDGARQRATSPPSSVGQPAG